MQQYPFLYSLDEAEVFYDASTREYQISYHRVVQNIGTEPLVSLPLTIFVCVFPEEQELARQYYRLHPLHFENLQFVAQDDSGAALAHRIHLANDSQIEFDLLFQEAHGSRLLPVYPGETREIFYHYRLSDEMWGPFLRKNNRIPCEQMKVSLRFPKGLVEVWGQQCGSTAVTYEPLMPPIQQSLIAHEEMYTWSIAPAKLFTKYKFYWRFSDQRWLQFKERVERQLGGHPSDNGNLATHSADFRSVRWFGRKYEFTAIQAACLEILWQAWANGTPEIGQAYILETVGTKAQRVLDLFKKHPAWSTIIVPGNTRGTLRLKSPHEDKTAP